MLYSDVLKTRDAWNLGDVKIAYCAKNREDLEFGAKYGIDTIGIANGASEVLEKLKSDPYAVGNPKAENVQKKEEPKSIKRAGEPKTKKPREEKIDSLASLMADLSADSEEENVPVKEVEEPIVKKNDWTSIKPSTPATKVSVQNTKSGLALLDDDDEFDDFAGIDLEREYQSETSNVPDERPEPVRKKHIMQESERKGTVVDKIQAEFERDVHGDKEATKIVAVYSAKGGVGKTTIASELAMYLSLVNLGRRNLRVCIVDYNIDFGDVKTTLGLERNDENLTKSVTYWADEVREFLDKGDKPEEIVYTKEEIEQYLARDEKSGLWVLPAPFSNEDSALIEADELEIILKNLKEHGEFDYIICDTGNNTRDSTMIALRNADLILMIMTQNINTANCDKSFMNTMETVNFDLSNTRLVINNIVPQKLTGMSVQEIEDYFPFECVGRIKYNPDVIKATNLGEPLAFDPAHEFTKQMKEIVAFVLNDDSLKDDDLDTKADKKGLFGFLFKKKK